MKYRSLAPIIIAILLVQPLIFYSGMVLGKTLLNTASSTVLSQEPGTRLSPAEHVNHVPIIINGTADFESQGWPGDGSLGNPYLIAGLNITYDMNVIGIEIFNTDAYFVIRDCYVNQLSIGLAVFIHDTSHGAIEFSTIISEEGGIYCDNANGTNVSHVSSIASGISLYFYGSYDCTSEFNYLYSYNIRGFTAEYSHFLTTQSNTIETEAPIWYSAAFFFCNDTTSIDDSSVNGLASYAISYSYRTTITGLFLSSNDLGLRIDNSHDITVDGLHAEGISVTGAVYITFSTDVTVTNSYITSSNGFGLHVYRSNTTTIDDCEIENIGGGIGIHFENSLWCSAADNHLSTTGTSGIYLTNSNNTLLEANHLTDCEEYGIALQNSINVEIIDNDILNPLFNGIYCDIASHDGLIEGNHLTTPGLSAIVIVSANWTIQDNVITKCVYGIQITNSPDANIYRNDVSEASSQGIRILSCPDSDVVNNTVSMATQEGIYISGSPRSNLEGNIVTDIATGISLAQCVNSTISRNVVTRSSSISIRLYQSSGLLASENSIIDPDYLGMWTKYVTTSTFLDNTFTNGNFYFETQQTLAEVSHTFSGNTVNGLPLYYGLNQTGLTLNGASYGEIILVNCNDSSIEGGTFVDSGAVFLILFCDEVSINNVHGIDLSVGNMVWRSTNVELANSVFEGSSKFVGVAFLQSDNITMSNVNFTDVDDTNYASVLSENTPHFSISDSNFIRCDDAIEITWMGNFSITDCTFMDLDGNAIYANTAHYGVIKDNVIHGSAHGILVGGHHYIVENNEVWYANRAIWASGSNSHNATIRFNDLQSNNYGIYYEYADDWVITNNTIMWNYLYGIYQGSLVDSAQISYNIFLLNGLGNAYDGGSTQFWDDGVDTGNWWHDYDGTGPYDILGTAGSQDRYPMKYMVNLPIINQPPDIEYAEGSTGNEIVWSPFDDYLRDWVVKGDGVEWASGKWDFTPITVNIDGLAYGTHTFEITVWDVDQNFVSDTVVVHVYDDTPPVISGPANLWLFVDATGQTIEWEVADLHPDNYVLAVDDVEFRTGPWTSGILSINVDGIDEGEHLLLLTIYDIDGNLATDSFLVLVIDDNDNPTIEDAEDVIYLEGTTGNTLEWDADDAYPAFYEVSYNGTVVEDGAWGGSRIAFDVDGLDPGVHEFTLTVYDLSGNSAMNSANVTVIPLVPLQPPFLADWLVALIIGAAVGGVAVVVIIIYYLRKKRGS